VIFEEAYTNMPGVVVSRQSTELEVSYYVYGGTNGGTYAFTLLNGSRLEQVSGGTLPVTGHVAAAESRTITARYRGRLPSASENDVEAVATFVEDVTARTLPAARDQMTAVKVELDAVYVASGNPDQHRHVYGVGERIQLRHEPSDATVEWTVRGGDYHSEIVEDAGCDGLLRLHFLGGSTTILGVSHEDADYTSKIDLVEPEGVVCRHQAWDGTCAPVGQAGGFGMNLELYIVPTNVSFQGIDVSEIPCNTIIPPTGYYSLTNFNGVLSHCLAAGAGPWHHVKPGNYWCVDNAGSGIRRPVWTDGTMTWNIPIQWYQRLEDSSSWSVGTVHAAGRLIGGAEDAYQQVFDINADGTVRVTKHQHWIDRTTNAVIRLDGSIIHQGD